LLDLDGVYDHIGSSDPIMARKSVVTDVMCMEMHYVVAPSGMHYG
jgi:hypothetical protein